MLKTIILFILMLCLITIIHEFGHFIAAKAFGVYVYEFSIGMGPKLYYHKGKETNFSIRALPLGGFVSLAGDEDNNNPDVDMPKVDIPKSRTLKGIHPIKKIIIMVSGVVMNFILAIAIMSLVFLSIGKTTVAPDAVIQEVNTKYPAFEAGILKGDKVVSAYMDSGYSMEINSSEEVSNFFALYDGTGNIHLIVDRNGKELDVPIKPIYLEDESRYVVGITFSEYKFIDVTIKNCVGVAVNYLWTSTKLIVITLLGLFRGIGFNNVSGPVGVFEVTGEAISYGIESYLNLIAVISLNVGIFNLLPIPVMDGGRILITFIEMILGKDLDKKIENAIMAFSVSLLFVFFIYVTFKDIIKLLF